jgi:NitT/TauT family transport system ATP-binding protein
MGLESPDAGSVVFSGGPPKPRFGAVFQEDRLFEDFDAVTNLRLAAGSARREEIRAELLKLLPEDAVSKPVSSLSGGQRRRAAIVWAIISPGDVLIMDEPFAGLDAENTRLAMEYLRESSLSRPLILAVHEKDVPPWCDRVSVE